MGKEFGATRLIFLYVTQISQRLLNKTLNSKFLSDRPISILFFVLHFRYLAFYQKVGKNTKHPVEPCKPCDEAIAQVSMLT